MCFDHAAGSDSVRRLAALSIAVLHLGCGGAQAPAAEPHGVANTTSPHALSTRAPSTTTTLIETNPRGRGSNQERAVYAQGFLQGCESACTQGAALCSAYCSCMNVRVMRDGQGPHLDELAPQGNEALMRDPWFQQAFAACGSDIHDVSFLRGCTSSCPNCGAYCQCAIDHMRSGMTREEGTAWFLEHIDSTITPAGQAALDAAVQACMPLRPSN